LNSNVSTFKFGALALAHFNPFFKNKNDQTGTCFSFYLKLLFLFLNSSERLKKKKNKFRVVRNGMVCVLCYYPYGGVESFDVYGDNATMLPTFFCCPTPPPSLPSSSSY
jgi:hypothetical protein